MYSIPLKFSFWLPVEAPGLIIVRLIVFACRCLFQSLIVHHHWHPVDFRLPGTHDLFVLHEVSHFLPLSMSFCTVCLFVSSCLLFCPLHYRYKDSICPEIPQPRDLISDIYENNNTVNRLLSSPPLKYQ